MLAADQRRPLVNLESKPRRRRSYSLVRIPLPDAKPRPFGKGRIGIFCFGLRHAVGVASIVTFICNAA